MVMLIIYREGKVRVQLIPVLFKFLLLEEE